MSTELFNQTEKLLSKTMDKLKATMLNEVQEHYWEISMDVLAGKPAFSEKTTDLMRAAHQLGEALAIFDKADEA